MSTTITVPSLDARHHLGEMLERVYYQAMQYRIVRKNKAMARLVGEPLMQAVDELMVSDQAFADTLALRLNDEVQEAINQSQKEFEGGRKIPIEDAFR